MPVSDKYETILVHIPKTGGTSIEAAFDMHGSVENVGIVPYKWQRRDYQHLFGAGMQHMTIAEIRRFYATSSFDSYHNFGQIKRIIDLVLDHLKVGKTSRLLSKFDRYYKFAVVRNPYDRLVSGFAWLDGNWHKNVQPGKSEFRAYVDNILSARLYEKDVHVIPQHKFVELDGRIGVDKILRLETIENDFNELCDELGVNLALPKRMVSKHKQADDYFDDESRSLVYRLYEKDFEMFEYAR